MSIGLGHLQQLLSGVLGRHNPPGNGPSNPLIDGADGDIDLDGGAHQARQAALQQEGAAEARNENARWHSEGANEGAQRGHGHQHHGGPHGPGGPNGRNGPGGPHNGDFPGTNGLGHGRDALSQAGSALTGSGLLGKAGDLASNLLNSTTQTAAGLAARTLEAAPLAGAATAASALVSQAAVANHAMGPNVLAARNALHDAASAPLASAAARDVSMPTQAAPPGLTTANATVPASARASEAPLLQGRQDILPQGRTDQVAMGRTAMALPASGPPPAAPPVAAPAESVRPGLVATPPSVVPPSQSPPVDGRTSLSGNDRVSTARSDVPQQSPAGHTGGGPTRRSVRDGDEERMPGPMARLLAALGLIAGVGQAAQDDEDAPGHTNEGWLRLQWLFWVLALGGYACLAVALVVLLPGGNGFLDEARNPLGKQALVVGLVSSICAWWLARKLAANR